MYDPMLQHIASMQAQADQAPAEPKPAPCTFFATYTVVSTLASHTSDTHILDKLVEKYASHALPSASGQALQYVFVKPPSSASHQPSPVV